MITKDPDTHIYRANYKETLFFFVLYALLVIIRYKTNNIVSQICFLIPVVAFLFSKKNYFWLAFFFLLLESPGYLLHNFDTNYSLPQYGSLGKRSIYFHELIVLATIIKYFFLSKKNKIILTFRVPYAVIATYIIFLFIISFIFGIEEYKIYRTLRFLLVYALILTLPILLTKKEDYFKFFSLIFPIVFLVVFIQIAEFILETPSMANLLGGNPFLIDNIDYSSQTDRMSRPLYAPFLIEFISIGVIFFLSYRKKIFNNLYLYSCLVLSIIAVYLSATRGLVLALASFIIGYMVFIQKKSYIIYTLIILTLFIAISTSVLIYFPAVKEQFARSSERMLTMQYLFQGDLTAGGTLARLSDRGPRVYDQFIENPILGVGFSDIFWEYSDAHVGHHTMLLNGGIVGYCIFIFFCIYFIHKVIRTKNMLTPENPYNSCLIVLIIGFCGLLVHHSTSSMIFSYIITWPYNGWFLLVAFFLSFSDFVIKDALREEQNKYST